MKVNFTEDREEWQKELRRQCEEVYTDQEETKEVQQNRIEYFAREFTVEGRTAEITVDLVLQARAKLSDNKVKGPEDAIVSEMIKQLVAFGENLHYYEVFSRTLLGPDGISKFVEDCETGLLEETRC